MKGIGMIEPEFDVLDHGHRKVRRAVAVPGELCDAVMDIALSDQVSWTPQEVKRLNVELNKCDLTIAQWLARRGE